MTDDDRHAHPERLTRRQAAGVRERIERHVDRIVSIQQLPPRLRALELELLALTDVADRPVTMVPPGTGRIVELARALATEPQIVLLDEPTSGLDGHETEQVAAALRTIRAERGVACVLVEHDVELVLDLCDQVTVLDFGRVIARGEPGAIRASSAVQAAYLGTAPTSATP